MSAVRAGDIIAGKFQIERVLGEGGMGYVVAARHLQLGQTVALKFMREDVLTNDYKSRFLREARNTVRLKSKHVSRVLDVGALDGGAPYMVMEYLEGTDLSELLKKRGSLPPHEACDYVIQACEAIAEAHGHGIVHRDLKPANLFLTTGSGGEPIIKVLDFGVSKVLDLDMDDDTSAGGRRGHHDSVVTKVTDLLGSPSYMAPEQIVSARDADARSDVWSLGIILYRLISGKAPFIGASLGDLIQNIVHGPMPNLRELRPDLPHGLEYVVWQCLERDRERRPDVVALARLLAPYAGPSVAPSLERIAILGPALITAVPQPIPSGTGAKSNWTTPPAISSRQPARKDMSTASFVAWALLFALVVASFVVIGAKLFPTRLAASGPHPPSTSAASMVAPASAPATAASTGSPSVSVATSLSPNELPPAPLTATATSEPPPLPASAPTTRPATRPTKPRPAPPKSATAPTPPTPPAPTSEIPGTRE